MWRPSTAILLLLGLIIVAHAGYDGAAWQSKTIYQFLTDRFNNPVNAPCANLSNYCGGTWAAATEQLDYILGMGFDAIWISPVVENTPGGYHGYWTQDFQQVNPYFGTEQDLKNFVQACHAKGIWVMVDIVANHVGPVDTDYTTIVPYNQSSDYHKECQVNNYVCFTDETLLCRLANLPDLNQTVPYVRQYLFDWIKNLMETFDFDGIRADTVMYIEQDFWVTFTEYAGAYIVGEVYSSVDCCISYQEQGVPGVLSYPMFFTLRSVFQQGQSMNQIQGQLQAYQGFPNQNLLGNFIDNQDQPRFLNGTSNVAAYWNAITFVLMSEGIPIIYYGTEQNFHGGNDPNNREILWPSKFNTSASTYQFISQVVNFRKSKQVWNYPFVQRYSTDNFYAFTRGNSFVALTNTMNTVTYTITYQSYPDGTQLCNIFATPSQPDCITVQNGQFSVTLGLGLPKIYYPTSS